MELNFIIICLTLYCFYWVLQYSEIGIVEKVRHYINLELAKRKAANKKSWALFYIPTCPICFPFWIHLVTSPFASFLHVEQSFAVGIACLFLHYFLLALNSISAK